MQISALSVAVGIKVPSTSSSSSRTADTVTTDTNTGTGETQTDSEAAQKLLDAQDALARLRQLSQANKEAAKSYAQQKVARIKERLEQLQKMRLLLDPKALAKLIAQISRELASAVKSYVQAGGTDAGVTGATAQTATTGAAGTNAADADTSAAKEGSDEATTATEATTTANGPVGETTDGDRRDSESDGIKSDADQTFLQEVRSLARQLKAMLEQAKNKIGSREKTQKTDVVAARKALEEIDRALDGAGTGLAGANSSVGAVVDINA